MVIPVLMVILGGIMWLGQLQINRARLLAADRYIAWNLANRHHQDRAATEFRDELEDSEPPHRIFLDAPELGQHERLGLPDAETMPSGSFWRWAEARVAMEVSAPRIVSALFAAPETMWPDARAGHDLRVTELRAQRPDLRHFVLARAPVNHYAGSRFNRDEPVNCDEELLIDWNAVEDEAWFVE